MKRLTAVWCMALLLVIFSVACEARDVGRLAGAAVAATDVALAATPPTAPQRGELTTLREGLAQFQRDVGTAQTTPAKLNLVLALVVLTTQFERLRGVGGMAALARVNVALRALARKMTCLVARYAPQKIPDNGSAAQLAAVYQARDRLAVFAGQEV